MSAPLSVPAPIAALIEYLMADPLIAAEVAGRVYGVRVPGSEISTMPRASVLITLAGGAGFGQGEKLYYQNFDVRTFGASALEADLVQTMCRLALGKLRPFKSVQANCLLYSAEMLNGANLLFDPELAWPGEFTTWAIAYKHTGVN